jgi:hypothetical protein
MLEEEEDPEEIEGVSELDSEHGDLVLVPITLLLAVSLL